jgi:hypothetical protein
LGSGLNAGNIGAEIDVIKPTLPAQTHAPIAIHFAFGVSRTSFLYCRAHFARLALGILFARRPFIAPSIYKIAQWLGDDMRVVQKHYAKLLPKDADIEAAFS